MKKYLLIILFALCSNLILAQTCTVNSVEKFMTSSSKTTSLLEIDNDTLGNIYYLYADTITSVLPAIVAKNALPTISSAILKLKKYNNATGFYENLPNISNDFIGYPKMALCKAVMTNSTIAYTPHVFYQEANGSNYVKYFNGLNWIKKVNTPNSDSSVYNLNAITTAAIEWNKFKNTISILYIIANQTKSLIYSEYDNVNNTWIPIAPGKSIIDTTIENAILSIDPINGTAYVGKTNNTTFTYNIVKYYTNPSNKWDTITGYTGLPSGYANHQITMLGNGEFSHTYINDGDIEGYHYKENNPNTIKYYALNQLGNRLYLAFAAANYSVNDSIFKIAGISNDSIYIFSRTKSQATWTQNNFILNNTPSVRPFISSAILYNGTNKEFVTACQGQTGTLVNNNPIFLSSRSTKYNPILIEKTIGNIQELTGPLNLYASALINQYSIANAKLQTSFVDKNKKIHYLYTNEYDQLFYIEDFNNNTGLVNQSAIGLVDDDVVSLELTVTNDNIVYMGFINFNGDYSIFKKPVNLSSISLFQTIPGPVRLAAMANTPNNNLYIALEKSLDTLYTYNLNTVTNILTLIDTISTPLSTNVDNLNISSFGQINGIRECNLLLSFSSESGSKDLYVYAIDTVVRNFVINNDAINGNAVPFHFKNEAIYAYIKNTNANEYKLKIDNYTNLGSNSPNVNTINLPAIDDTATSFVASNLYADNLGIVYVNAIKKSLLPDVSDSLIVYVISNETQNSTLINQRVSIAVPVNFDLKNLSPSYLDANNSLFTVVDGLRYKVNVNPALPQFTTSTPLCTETSVSIASVPNNLSNRFNYVVTADKGLYNNGTYHLLNTSMPLSAYILNQNNYDINLNNYNTTNAIVEITNFTSIAPTTVSPVLHFIEHSTCGTPIHLYKFPLIILVSPSATSNLIPADSVCNGDSVQITITPTGGTSIASIIWGTANLSGLSPTYLSTVTNSYDTLRPLIIATNACATELPIIIKYISPSLTISGQVTTPANLPLPFGEVIAFKLRSTFGLIDTLIDTNYLTQFLNYSPVVLGSYTISPFSPGKYILVAKEDTLLSGSNNNYLDTYYGGGTSWNDVLTDTVTVGCNAPNINTVDIQLKGLNPFITGPGSITGFVTSGPGFGNRIKKQNNNQILGIPIGGVKVTPGRNPTGSAERTGFTNASGQYNFSNMPLASYRIAVDILGLFQDSTYNVNLTASNPIVNNLNYLVDSAAIRVDLTNSIEELKTLATFIKLYPNPSTDILIVQFDNKNAEDLELGIYDLQGKQVYNYTDHIPAGQHHLSIHLKQIQLKNGNYIIKGQLGKHKISKSFVVNN